MSKGGGVLAVFFLTWLRAADVWLTLALLVCTFRVRLQLHTQQCPTASRSRDRASQSAPQSNRLTHPPYTRAGSGTGATPLRRKMACVSRFSGATTRSSSKPRRVMSGSQSALRLLCTPT